MKKLIFALAACAIISAAPAMAERATGHDARTTAAPVIKLTPAPKTIDTTKPDSAPRGMSPGGIVGNLGQDGDNASKNPNTGVTQLKNDLEKQKWKKQSQEAREEADRAESGLGAAQEQAKDMTKPDKKTAESMKVTMDKKKALAALQKSCKKECYPELSSGKEDENSSWIPDGYNPMGNYKKPKVGFPHIKTDEEKAAEEEAKKKQEYINSLPKAERQKICYQDCLARGQ